MTISETDILSELEELSADAFEAFCGDISGMFGIDMESELSSDSKETAVSLKKKFKKFCGVITVKATGILDGELHIIFNKEALFTLSGTIVMFPEKRILDNCKKGTLVDAKEQHDAVGETGNLLVGSWDRIFRENLEGHTHFLQTGTYIGNPWNDSEKVLGISKEEEFLYFDCEMTVGQFPSFQCGVIYPNSIFQQAPQADTTEAPKEKEKVSEDSKTETEVDTSAESQEVPEEAQKQVESQPQEDSEKPENAALEDQEIDKKEDQQLVSESQEEHKEPESAETEPEASEESENTIEEADIQEHNDDDQASRSEDAESKVEEPTETSSLSEPREAAGGAVSETIQKMIQSMPSLSPIDTSSMLKTPAEDIMSKQVLWGKPDDGVQNAMEKIQQADTSCMLIGNSDALEGIVTWIDVAEAVSIYLRPVFAKWRRPVDDATLQIKLKIIMTRPVRTIKPKTSLGAILEDMCQHRLRCLPVINEQGKVEGVVTASDIFKFLLKMSPDFSITDSASKSA